MENISSVAKCEVDDAYPETVKNEIVEAEEMLVNKSDFGNLDGGIETSRVQDEAADLTEDEVSSMTKSEHNYENIKESEALDKQQDRNNKSHSDDYDEGRM